MRGNLFVGFLTGGQLGDLGSSLSWAEKHGFRSISIAAPPENSILSIPEVLSDPTPVKAVLRDSKAIVSALGFYGNPIHSDLATRKANKDTSFALSRHATNSMFPSPPDGLACTRDLSRTTSGSSRRSSLT